VDKERSGIIDETFAVRENIFISLEVSDEFLEFTEDGVAAWSCGRRIGSRFRELRLVAVVHSSFVPP